jgi:hypothetical protein
VREVGPHDPAVSLLPEMRASLAQKMDASSVFLREDFGSFDLATAKQLHLTVSDDRIVLDPEAVPTRMTITRQAEDISQPLAVALFSSNPYELHMPASVVIPAGISTVVVDVTAGDGPDVANEPFVSIAIAAEGYRITTTMLSVVTDDGTSDGTDTTHQNPENACDVDGDGFVTPNDVLRVVQYLNMNGVRLVPPSLDRPPFIDVSGDGVVSPRDAMLVINYLHTPALAQPPGEGENANANPHETSLRWFNSEAVVDVISGGGTIASDGSATHSAYLRQEDGFAYGGANRVPTLQMDGMGTPLVAPSTAIAFVSPCDLQLSYPTAVRSGSAPSTWDDAGGQRVLFSHDRSEDDPMTVDLPSDQLMHEREDDLLERHLAATDEVFSRIGVLRVSTVR